MFSEFRLLTRVDWQGFPNGSILIKKLHRLPAPCGDLVERVKWVYRESFEFGSDITLQASCPLREAAEEHVIELGRRPSVDDAELRSARVGSGTSFGLHGQMSIVRWRSPDTSWILRQPPAKSRLERRKMRGFPGP
jgi:hypothetical protein